MRIATFNLLHGRSLSDGVVDPDRLTAAVRELDPDVLALQEVDRDQPRSHLADLTAIAAAAMGATAHRMAPAVRGTPGESWVPATDDDEPGTRAYGVALLSRFPARSWRVVRLPRLPLRVPVWVPGVNRPAIVREEPRVAAVGVFDTPLGELTVANTHLTFVPGWNRLQLARLRSELAAVAGPLVLTGDLNMIAPRLPGFRALASTPTFPVDAPRVQLDHILARGELPPVIASRSVATALSDHRALVVDLAETGRPASDGRLR